MMTFMQFAESYGLVIDHILDGRWVRVKTVDKPKKRNGSYKYLGEIGFVQNHATMEQVAMWKDGARAGFVDKAALRARMAISVAAESAKHAEARVRAQKILDRCTLAKHPYLSAKGFPRDVMPVLDGQLVIPMRDFKDYKTLNSLQFISPDGEKKFLPGGKAKASVYGIGPWRPREMWLVEGYATALSVRLALEQLHREVAVVTCFSAGNLAYVGRLTKMRGKPAYVFADHDESGAGQRAAEETELPWTMPPETGMDANDVHRRDGLRALVALIREIKQTTNA